MVYLIGSIFITISAVLLEILTPADAGVETMFLLKTGSTILYLVAFVLLELSVSYSGFGTLFSLWAVSTAVGIILGTEIYWDEFQEITDLIYIGVVGLGVVGLWGANWLEDSGRL